VQRVQDTLDAQAAEQEQADFYEQSQRNADDYGRSLQQAGFSGWQPGGGH
jgi:hypothetical protein